MSSERPIAEFVVRMDDAYFRGAAARLAPKPSGGRFSGVASTALAVVALLGYTIRCVGERDWAGLVWPVGFFALLAVVLFAVRQKSRASIRNGPDYGKDVRIRIASDGVEMIGSAASTSWTWSGFSRADVRPDGILLVMKDKAGLWIPTGSPVSGSVDSAGAVISAHVPEVERKAG